MPDLLAGTKHIGGVLPEMVKKSPFAEDDGAQKSILKKTMGFFYGFIQLVPAGNFGSNSRGQRASASVAVHTGYALGVECAEVGFGECQHIG